MINYYYCLIEKLGAMSTLLVSIRMGHPSVSKCRFTRYPMEYGIENSGYIVKNKMFNGVGTTEPLCSYPFFIELFDTVHIIAE